ncbi:hypothetical protein FRB90_006872, partial [Tulasnella sp. 427]
NTLDWSITVDDEQYGRLLDKVEFTSLPSGLHGVERDVVYFNKDGYDAVACFWRKENETKDDRRGYQMEAYGVLLERSAYPRPWRHVPTLKTIHDKDALERYFTLHRKPTTAGDNSDSSPLSFDWDAELLSSSSSSHSSSAAGSSSSHPLIHLPHLLRIVGPSFLTIFKHLLSRRRVLFLTTAPVEAACLLTKACVDVAFPDVVMGSAGENNGGGSATEDEAGLERDDRRPAVLGQVGLMDIDRLKAESQTGLGWIACTTDSIFKDRPALYDLIVDLTTATNSLAPSSPSPTITRPTLLMSRPTLSSASSPSKSPQSGSSYKLQLVRFTFSDIRLWTKIDKVLRECPVPHAHGSHEHGKGKEKEKAKESRSWSDFLPWKLYTYEDVCIVCASIWLKGSDGNSGVIRLEGEDNTILIGRGKATASDEASKATTSLLSSSTRRRNPLRRASERSASSSSSGSSGSSRSSLERRYSEFPPDVRTALMVLDILHTQANFWLDSLQDLIVLNDATTGAKLAQKASGTNNGKKDATIVPLYPSHLIALQLSSLSDVDSRFVEWLAQARFDRTAVVKRGWKDLVAAIVEMNNNPDTSAGQAPVTALDVNTGQNPDSAAGPDVNENISRMRKDVIKLIGDIAWTGNSKKAAQDLQHAVEDLPVLPDDAAQSSTKLQEALANLSKALVRVRARLEEASRKYGIKDKGIRHRIEHLAAHADRQGGIQLMESCRDDVRGAMDQLKAALENGNPEGTYGDAHVWIAGEDLACAAVDITSTAPVQAQHQPPVDQNESSNRAIALSTAKIVFNAVETGSEMIPIVGQYLGGAAKVGSTIIEMIEGMDGNQDLAKRLEARVASISGYLHHFQKPPREDQKEESSKNILDLQL